VEDMENSCVSILEITDNSSLYLPPHRKYSTENCFSNHAGG
jgi:hypothetical protein